MSEFTRILKKKVEYSLGRGAVWGDVNPLIVIGLSEAMLDLGLTEEQMYRVVKSYARQLAGQIHPDKKVGNVSEERQRQINLAFNYLDDRKNFSRAMSEFRLLKSDERNEVKLLTEALTVSRGELEVHRAKELSLSRGLEQLQRDREAFDRVEDSLRTQIPKLNVDLQQQYLLAVRHHRRASSWKRRHDSAMAYIHSLSPNEKQPGSGVHTFEARWIAVASFISAKELKSDKAPALAFQSSGKLSLAFIEATKMLGLSNGDVLGIVETWGKWFKKFKRKADPEFRRHYNPCLTLLSLSAGKPELVFGWGQPFAKGRIIGSLSSEKRSIRYVELTVSIDREAIFEQLSPRLAPEGLIVLQVLMRENKYPSGHSLKYMRFDTKHLILGVG